MSLPSLGTTYHNTSYPAISPSQPFLSQAGRTVLITGGGGGIGFEIARSFAQASAFRIIIVGRRSALLDEAVAKLRDEFGTNGVPTEFIARQGDIGDDTSISALWDHLHSQGIIVNVLVLNAASFGPNGPDTLRLDKEEIMRGFQVNVGGNFLMTQKFVNQALRPSTPAADHQLYLVNISTAQIHMYPATPDNTYASSKTAWMAMLGRIADQSKVDELQIVSYHPGALYSEQSSKYIEKHLVNWDDMSLPADYAVWAASPAASWLHGRFVWAHWDVDELRAAVTDTNNEVGNQMQSEEGFLKVGVLGLPSVSLKSFLKE